MDTETTTEVWLHLFSALVLITTFTIIGSQITSLGAFRTLIIVISIVLFGASLLMFEHKHKFAHRIAEYYDEQSNEKFIKGIEDRLPAGWIFLVSILIFVILVADVFYYDFNSQVYGLVMDGFGGGIFLPRQRIQSEPGTMNVSNRLDGRDITDGIFGAGLLVSGFSLQGLSIILP